MTLTLGINVSVLGQSSSEQPFLNLLKNSADWVGELNGPFGTANGAKTDATGYAVGTTVITLGQVGTGTILNDDVIYFNTPAGFVDGEQICGVAIGCADVSAPGAQITLKAPGLLTALNATQHNITISSTTYQTSIDLDVNGYPQTMNGINQATNRTFADVFRVFVYDIGPRTTNWAETSPYYPPVVGSGQYICLYDGAGTLSYDGGGVTGYSSAAGRDVINVTPAGDRIHVRIHATTVGNYIKNMRFVYSGYESMLNSGEIFMPEFIAKITPFKRIRFGVWTSTDVYQVANWSDRAIPTYISWCHNGAAPYEVMIALCNKINAEPWLCTPILASDDFIENMARLFHDGATDNLGHVWSCLNGNLSVYSEYGNELWMSGKSNQQPVAVTRGKDLYPIWGSQPDNALFDYCLTRAAQNAIIWRYVWDGYGELARLKQVLGGQQSNSGGSGRNQQDIGKWTATHYGDGSSNGGYTFTATGTVSNGSGGTGTKLTLSGITGTVHTYQLIQDAGNHFLPGTFIESDNGDGTWTVNRSQNVGPFTITGTYFDGYLKDHFNGQYFTTATYWGNVNSGAVPSSITVNQLFSEGVYSGNTTLIPGIYAGGWLAQTLAWNTGDKGDATAMNMTYISYEGGPGFTSADVTLKETLRLMAHDPQMKQAITTWLGQMAGNNVSMLMYYYLAGFDYVGAPGCQLWGSVQNIFQTTDTKYNALTDFITPPLGATKRKKHIVVHQ